MKGELPLFRFDKKFIKAKQRIHTFILQVKSVFYLNLPHDFASVSDCLEVGQRKK
jgi:hypothetical protein